MPTPEEIFARMADRPDPDDARRLNAVVQFHLEGPAGGARHVVLRDGAITVARGVHRTPTMSLTLRDVDFVALASGELSPQRAFMDRRVQIAGDVGMAVELLSVLGLGRP